MGKYFDKQTLITALQKKAETLGRIPTPEDMTDPPAQAYLGYFKKWNKALMAAQIQSLLTSEKKSVTPRAKSETESVQKEAPAPVTKPVTDTKETAACGRRRYSKAIITQMLVDEFKRLGKKPTRKEIDANKNLPTVATCLNYFDTTRIGDVWEEVLKEI